MVYSLDWVMGTIFGDLLRYYREKASLSQATLADGICSREYIWKIETGKCLPSIDIVSKLSERLNIDLYGAFGSITNHHDAATHIICTSFADAFKKKDYAGISELLELYENAEAFLSGDPRQIICYAKSVIAFEVDSDASWGEWALTGILVNNPSFSETRELNTFPSNIEFNLAKSYAIYLCLTGQTDYGLLLLNTVKEKALTLLNTCLYSLEYHRSFWINTICTCVYHQFVFSNSLDEMMLESISDALLLKKKSNRSHMLAELLLCKAILLMNLSFTEQALKAYNSACAIGMFYYKDNYFAEKVRDKLVGKFSDIDLFERNPQSVACSVDIPPES